MARIEGTSLRRLERDAERIGKALSSFSESARLFSSSSARLIDRYEDKWVGVYEGEIAASAGSLQEVTREIARKKIPLSETMIRRIDKDEKTLILQVMLNGFYEDSTGRPFLTAYVILLGMNVAGSVSFLMDTGADKTVIMPTDAKRLGIKYTALSRTVECIGVGGRSSDFLERAQILLKDGSSLHAYDTDIIVMRRKKALLNTPSLLGRNIMKRWRMVFDKSNDVLTIEILSSDAQVPLP